MRWPFSCRKLEVTIETFSLKAANSLEIEENLAGVIAIRTNELVVTKILNRTRTLKFGKLKNSEIEF